MAISVSSPAFEANGLIPAKFTCDGQDISPALEFGNVPEAARSLVLIVDDPDAPVGTWDHWILFNLPPQTKALPENAKSLPEGALTGVNSWKRTSYGGPCPPDKEHRYFFTLYALDTTLSLKSGASKKEIEAAMQDHVLEKAELIGRYDRPRR